LASAQSLAGERPVEMFRAARGPARPGARSPAPPCPVSPPPVPLFLLSRSEPDEGWINVLPRRSARTHSAIPVGEEDPRRAPWSFGTYGEEADRVRVDDHKWWRGGDNDARASASSSANRDVERFWRKVNGGGGALAEVQGSGDAEGMRAELQRTHLHLDMGAGMGYHAAPSHYSATISLRAREPAAVAEAARDWARAHAASRANKTRAQGASVQDALREDL